MMKRLFVVFMACLLLLVDCSITLATDSDIPTGKDFENHIGEPLDLISPEKLEPGLTIYRTELKIKKNYLDDQGAQRTLDQIYHELNNPNCYDTTCPEIAEMIISFIKNNNKTRQAVTAKLLLADLVGQPVPRNTLPSYYWSIDLAREVYIDFPDKWQGKLALYYIYQRIYFPIMHWDIEWCYQNFDEFEAVNLEMEKLFASENKDPGLLQYENYNNYLLGWLNLWQGYCSASFYTHIIEHGLQDEMEKNAQRTFQHMWDMCKKGDRYCSAKKEHLQDLYNAQIRSPADRDGPCIPDELE